MVIIMKRTDGDFMTLALRPLLDVLPVLLGVDIIQEGLWKPETRLRFGASTINHDCGMGDIIILYHIESRSLFNSTR